VSVVPVASVAGDSSATAGAVEAIGVAAGADGAAADGYVGVDLANAAPVAGCRAVGLAGGPCWPELELEFDRCVHLVARIERRRRANALHAARAIGDAGADQRQCLGLELVYELVGHLFAKRSHCDAWRWRWMGVGT
jgi:hypothetical protein